MRNALLFVLSLGLAASASANRLSGGQALQAGSNPRGVLAADLNGDGLDELVVANFGSPTLIGQASAESKSSIQVFSRVEGALGLAQTIPAPGSPRGLAAADLNQDGRLDLLASLYDSGTLAIYLQNADGSFTQAAGVPTGVHPVGVAVAKVGGQLMVAVANYNSDSVSLFVSRGDGGLNALPAFTAGSNPTDVEIYAPEGGAAVLIVANYTGNSISLAPLTSAGAGVRADRPLPGNPCRVAVGELNGDSAPELAVALFAESRVAIYEGSASGFATDPVKVQLAGLHPNGLAIGKVTGSRLGAVITANRDSDQLDIVRLGVDQAYQVLVSLPAGSGTVHEYGPVEAAVGDFNGDGLADIAATHMRSGTALVFSQATPAAPALVSASHPDQSKFYASDSPSLSWDEPADLDGISHYLVALDQAPLSMPGDGTAATTLREAHFTGLSTGTYYVHARSVDKQGNLGEAAHYKIGVTADLSEANTYNYPNPTRDGRTTIRFALAEPVETQIRIFDEVSNLVWSRDLGAGQTIGGVNQLEWDGRNDRGQAVGNGGYLLQVSAKGKTVTKKIAVIR